MFEQTLNDSGLIEFLITRQEKCIHPSDALEFLNGKFVCTKCAKVMPEKEI